MKRKSWLTIAGGATLAISLTACGGGDNEGGIPQVSFGTSATGQVYYLTQIIENFDLDKEHGFDLEVVPLALDAVPGTLAGGQIDVGFLAPSGAATLNSQGKSPVQQIAPLIYSGNSLVVPQDSSVTSFKDLQGKVMANFDTSTGAYFFGAVLAESEGVDLTSIDQVPGDAPEQMTQLKRGDVEAVVVYEPYTGQLVSTGDYKVGLNFDAALSEEFGTKPMKVGLAARTEWIEENTHLIPKIQAAVNDALIMINDKEEQDFFSSVAEEAYGLQTQGEIDRAWELNSENFAEPAPWPADMTDGQTAILKRGVEVGALEPFSDDSAYDMWSYMNSFDPAEVASE